MPYKEIKTLSLNEKRRPSDWEFPFIVATSNAAYRRDVIKELGFFDPNLKNGGDADLAWRAQWAGYQISFAPNAIIYHRERKTLTGMIEQFFRFGKSKPTLVKKHHKRFKKRFYVKRNRFISLIRNLIFIVPSLINGKNKEEKLEPLFRFINHLSFITGTIYGSILSRVIYLG